MLRKIITELAYSPALAGNLGYYIKQLRSEASRREIGLIFVALAVIVQLFATLLPPESANTNNPAAFVDGGIQSIDEYLVHYDKNTSNIRDLLDSLGIQRQEIEAAKLTNTLPTTKHFIWSMENTRENDENVNFFTSSNTSQRAAYFRPSSLNDDTLQVYIATSSQHGGWFGITADGARLITEKSPTSPCSAWLLSPENPLPINSWLSSQDTVCQSMVSSSLSARKISSSTHELEELKASDRIAYTVSVKNTTDREMPVAPTVNLEDILEYSRILDYGGGEYDFDTKNLTWPPTRLEVGGDISRTLIVQILPTMPATARGEFIKQSYDCEITLSFGTTLSNPVNCPPAKFVENATNSIRQLSTIPNIIASVVIVTISVFLYARSRQLLSELYIIRHNHLGGL